MLFVSVIGSIREAENRQTNGEPELELIRNFLPKLKSFTPSSRHMATLSGPSVCLYLRFSPTPPRSSLAPPPPHPHPPAHTLHCAAGPSSTSPPCPAGWQTTGALPPCSSNWWHCSHAAPPPQPPPPRTYAHSCPVAHAQCEHLLAAGATHT